MDSANGSDFGQPIHLQVAFHSPFGSCDMPQSRRYQHQRAVPLLVQLSSRVGSATPWACQDWANTKAAYRFFGNDRVSEANILAGHFSSTRERFVATSDSPVLILHDTTESAQLRHGQRHFTSFRLQVPLIAASARVLAPLAALILPGSDQPIRFGVKQGVQRLFHRGPHHLVQVGLDPPLVDLHYGTHYWLHSTACSYFRFLGWLHLLRLRGLTPPACTSLHRLPAMYEK